MFKLPILPYKYNALEPYIDSLTMEIHYTKHHASYTLNLNNAIKQLNLCEKSIEQILKNNIDNTDIRNNGGGYYNHNLFWKIISPNKKYNKPSDSLIVDINNKFGSFEKFKEIFSNVALKHFGSGWAWLYLNVNNELTINSTINQDNPLIIKDYGEPIIALDVWEHAYYLSYKNRRNEYIEAFWNVINWDEVSKIYKKIKK